MGSEQQRSATIRTNKASGLTAWKTSREADSLNKRGNEFLWDEWVLRHGDMVKKGMKPAKYHAFYLEDPERITDYKLRSFENMLGALTNAVKKYGSYEKAKRAFLADTGYMYLVVSAFIKWAPAGQRAKAEVTAEKPKDFRKEAMKYSVKELRAMLAFREAAMSEKFSR